MGGTVSPLLRLKLKRDSRFLRPAGIFSFSMILIHFHSETIKKTVKKFLPVLLCVITAGLNNFTQPIYGAELDNTSVVTGSASTDSMTADTATMLPDSMVLIPAGKYVIGNKKGLAEQKPEHSVTVKAFYIDIHEVTNAQYQVFLDSTGYALPMYWGDTLYNKPYQPVVGVSWYDAVEYCQWAGKRLPTEAEWEIAARGGLTGEDYPFKGKIDEDKVNYIFDKFEKPKGVLKAGSYPPNGYGLYDMAGNVYEWCSDWYSKTAYKDSSDYVNPQGPVKGEAKVMRGGSWNYIADFQQVAMRNRAKPELKANYIGFRCVKDAVNP